MLSKATNYMEIRNTYMKYRKNMVIAERDALQGDITQITPIEPKPVKITPKRKKILFLRDYLKDFTIITTRGVVREYKDVFRDTTESNKQLVDAFTVIMTDLIDMGVLRRYGSYRRKPRYLKIINPDNIEELRNDVQEK